MTGPKRIMRRRTKGWRMPEGAIYVGRPSVWGNPFPVDGSWSMWTAVALGYTGSPAGRRAAAVALHRAWLHTEAVALGPRAGSTEGGSLEFASGAVVTMDAHARGIAGIAAALSGPLTVPPSPIGDVRELAGHDLVCWCPLDRPCHADVLLELANADD